MCTAPGRQSEYSKRPPSLWLERTQTRIDGICRLSQKAEGPQMASCSLRHKNYYARPGLQCTAGDTSLCAGFQDPHMLGGLVHCGIKASDRCAFLLMIFPMISQHLSSKAGLQDWKGQYDWIAPQNKWLLCSDSLFLSWLLARACIQGNLKA